MAVDQIETTLRDALEAQPPVGAGGRDGVRRRVRRRRAKVRVGAAAGLLACAVAGAMLIGGTRPRHDERLRVASPDGWTVGADHVAEKALGPDGVSIEHVGGRTFFLVNENGKTKAYLTDVQHLPGEDELWWCPTEHEFAAPTHGERFDDQGAVVGGPATRGLDQLRTVTANGKVHVYLDDVTPGPTFDRASLRPMLPDERWDAGGSSYCQAPIKSRPDSRPTPTTEPTPQVTGIGIPGLRVVYGDRAYEQTSRNGTFVSLGEPAGADPGPVDTPEGIVSFSGTGGGRGTVWLAPPAGPPVRIAEGASGFAVSSDGLRLAYAIPDAPGTTSVLRELDLRTRAPVHEATYNCFVSVRAYAVNAVLLDICDGAAGSAASWLPSSGAVTRLGGFGHVLAADSQRNRLLISEGDGTCARPGSLGIDGVHVGTLEYGCDVRSLSSFDPSGRWLALATGDFYAPSIRFVDLDGSSGPGEVLAQRVVATAWIPASTDPNDPRRTDFVLFAVTVADIAKPRLLRCDPIERQCTVIQTLDERPNALLAVRADR